MKPRNLFAAFTESYVARRSDRFNRILAAFSILLAALFLYLAVRNLDWRVFLVTLQNVNYIYLPAVFVWSSLSFLVRAFRLRVPLGSQKSLPLSNVFWANMSGYLGNSILPARAGEIVRATYLARKNDLSLSFALAVGLVERLMDLAGLIVLGSFALSSVELLSPIIQNALKGVTLLGLIGLGATFTLPRFEAPVGRLIMTFPWIGEALKIRVSQLFSQFLGGLRALHNIKRLTLFLALTALIMLMDAVGAVILADILQIPLLLPQAFVLNAALGISSAVPSTPGYVGVYQFVAVTVLAPFGISRADALVYILISQILGYLNIGFWGVLSLLQYNRQVPT